MRQQLTLLVCILLISIPSTLAADDDLSRTILAHKLVSEDGNTQPLIEWFCDSDSHVCRDFAEDHAVLMDRDEKLVWLSWHPAYNEDDPLGNGDSNIRSDELMTIAPAIRLDFQRLEGIGDGTDFILYGDAFVPAFLGEAGSQDLRRADAKFAAPGQGIGDEFRRDDQDRQVDLFRHVVDALVTAPAQNFVMAAGDGIDGALVVMAAHHFHQAPAQNGRVGRGGDDGNNVRPQQGRQIRHGGYRS